MTKHDWFWVAVKIAGMVLMVGSLWGLTAAVTLLGDLPFGSLLLRLLFNVGAVGALGLWMVRDGRLLTEWARQSDREAPRA
ncbi:MAG: hypothetical protein AB7O97_13195 [Planctomycetota bacterium]